LKAWISEKEKTTKKMKMKKLGSIRRKGKGIKKLL
jgi:hypothetical protein